ncbi:ABC transporter substrate-binding protein [bacterium]|nr:ABC transporter substrate-binding protein [bacterium]
MIRIGHTPDADDAFMFYGINSHRVELSGLEIVHELQPMQQLNRWSLRGELEMTAFSFATYAQASCHYRPLRCGWSLGHGTGPQILALPGTSRQALREGLMASPGDLTSAHWLSRLWNPRQQFVSVPFDQTLEAIVSGRTLGAVVIHEGMMRAVEHGLVLVEDLGLWWAQETGGLPVPLGLNGVRRNLGAELQQRLGQALHDSIRLALHEVEPALDQALPLARGLDRERCREFVLRYVNSSTLDPGAQGERAVAEFYGRAAAAGWVEAPPLLDWIVPGKIESFNRFRES